MKLFFRYKQLKSFRSLWLAWGYNNSLRSNAWIAKLRSYHDEVRGRGYYFVILHSGLLFPSYIYRYFIEWICKFCIFWQGGKRGRKSQSPKRYYQTGYLPWIVFNKSKITISCFFLVATHLRFCRPHFIPLN